MVSLYDTIRNRFRDARLFLRGFWRDKNMNESAVCKFSKEGKCKLTQGYQRDALECDGTRKEREVCPLWLNE